MKTLTLEIADFHYLYAERLAASITNGRTIILFFMTRSYAQRRLPNPSPFALRRSPPGVPTPD